MLERLRRWRDSLAMRLAGLLPRRVAYWAAIRVGAAATTGDHGSTPAPELLFVDALKRWAL
jgi:hypothetical protein